jgi:hypothetical protein
MAKQKSLENTFTLRFLSLFVNFIKATVSQIIYIIKDKATQVVFYDFYRPLQINLTFF